MWRTRGSHTTICDTEDLVYNSRRASDTATAGVGFLYAPCRGYPDPLFSNYKCICAVAASPVTGSCAVMPGDGILSECNAKLIHSLAAYKDTTRQTGCLNVSSLLNAVWTSLELMPHSLCPRNVASQLLKCHTMKEMSELKIYGKCHSEAIKSDMQKGRNLVKPVDPTPYAFPGGFTCQLYSGMMRRVWAKAAVRRDIDYLRPQGEC